MMLMNSFKVSIRIVKDLWIYKSTIILILAPLILCPLLVNSSTKESKCLFVVLLMGIYWITESLPLAVTGLLPLILFPALGVIPVQKIATAYLQDSLILFISGYFVAIAVEQSQLHRRIALKALLIVGQNPKRVLFGMMATTSFLSMWISNTATAAMMLPILDVILIEIIKDNRLVSKCSNAIELTTTGKQQNETLTLSVEKLTVNELNLCKMMFISICYASNIGGVGTLTGTPPNIIVTGILETKYGLNTGVSFASWMALAVPIVVINFSFAYILLQIFFLGWRTTLSCKKANQNEGNVHDVILSNYNSLGQIRFKEKSVAAFFGTLILLWIFRSPKFVPGWSDLFRQGYVSDATASVCIMFLLFIFPSDWPDFLCLPSRDVHRKPKIREPLITWAECQAKFPWGIMLLVGGSFAMARGIEESGLSKTIGNYLTKLSYLSAPGICTVSALLATFVTEFTSNSATATILTPIISAVAENIHVNPLYLVLTSTISVSYAFMLPIASPTNAIVFRYGLLKVVDMAKVGIFMNIIAAGVTLLAMNTWGWVLFDLGTYPSWAPQPNSTMLEILSNSTNLT